jgi:hypothetical protein
VKSPLTPHSQARSTPPASSLAARPTATRTTSQPSRSLRSTPSRAQVTTRTSTRSVARRSVRPVSLPQCHMHQCLTCSCYRPGQVRRGRNCRPLCRVLHQGLDRLHPRRLQPDRGPLRRPYPRHDVGVGLNGSEPEQGCAQSLASPSIIPTHLPSSSAFCGRTWGASGAHVRPAGLSVLGSLCNSIISYSVSTRTFPQTVIASRMFAQ